MSAGGDSGYLVVLTTCGAGSAAHIAEALVGAHLAACVQQVPIDSTYRWQGEIKTDREILLLIKARAADYAALEAAILAQHDYETPEIVALPITHGLPAYLAWLRAATER